MRLRSASTTSSNASEIVKPKSSQVSPEDASARGTAYENKSKQWNKITNSIKIYPAKDMVLLSTVEKVGFKAMIKTLDPRLLLTVTVAP